jgi:hypothetical protein
VNIINHRHNEHDNSIIIDYKGEDSTVVNKAIKVTSISLNYFLDI